MAKGGHFEFLISFCVVNFLVSNKINQSLKVETQFTVEDNEMMVAAPTKDEVEQSVKSSNLHAAPGNDSITSFFILGMLLLMLQS